MYTNTDQFIGAYTMESATTQRVLDALTDESLKIPKSPGDISTADLAWHIANSGSHMLNHEGANLPEGGWTAPEGVTAAQIAARFKEITMGVLAFAESKLKGVDLSREANWFGHVLPLGVWLNVIVSHEAHHRGQISVLMRQAGITVPSIYGPNKEETEVMMAQMAAGEGGAH